MGMGIRSSGQQQVHHHRSHRPHPEGVQGNPGQTGQVAFNPFQGEIPQFGVNAAATYQQQDPLSLIQGTNYQA